MIRHRAVAIEIVKVREEKTLDSKNSNSMGDEAELEEEQTSLSRTRTETTRSHRWRVNDIPRARFFLSDELNLVMRAIIFFYDLLSLSRALKRGKRALLHAGPAMWSEHLVPHSRS